MKKDSGLIYIAQNAARHPTSPLEPLFRALYQEQPSFIMDSVDVVTDRNNIRKLLSFVSPASSRNALMPFVIDVELIGKTAIFCRQETATVEIINPGEFKGYGHEFEKAFTTDDIADSTGHHRIISYEFGGLGLVVRYETDGYVADASSSSQTDVGDIARKLGDLAISPGVKFPNSQLTLRRGGQVVPLESTLEIKTRASHASFNMSHILPQLWVSQTPKLVCAYHTKGLFPPPEVVDIEPQVKEWELLHQPELEKLAVLIRRVLSVIREWGEGATIRYDPTSDRLLLASRTTKRTALPDDLYSKWETG